MLRTNSPHEGLCRVDPRKEPLEASSRQAKPLFAPRPRRVTSPELIFRDSSLDRCEMEAICRDEMDSMLEKWHFRPIHRPDVELTSPPTRAGNPVILDSKFHAMPSTTFFARPKKSRSHHPSMSSSC